MMRVGIFSRSATNDFLWLLEFLHTFLPEDSVCTVAISNRSALSMTGISFAILYHSKTRGRINVTDVTDSLYDNELKDLYQALGKENVIVVIDDLKDNSEQEKDRILENQPSIRSRARDLLLFTEQEKKEGIINPTNAANRRKIQEMITGRSLSPNWIFQGSSSYSDRIDKRHSLGPWPLALGVLAVLVLYVVAVYWYNCRVLLW